MEVAYLRLEHYNDGTIGIGNDRPRLSWSVVGSARDWTQEEYQLEITRPGEVAEQAIVRSSQSRLVEWPWRPLKSRDRAVVRVRVKGIPDAGYSSWSRPVVAEVGLLGLQEWRCNLIEPLHDEVEAQPTRPVVFGSSVECRGRPSFARLYVTAHGIYEARINDVRVGDHVLAPGWTSYHHRLIYQTFDITKHLVADSANDIRIVVAEGWFGGRLGWNGGSSNIYGDSVGAIAMLVFGYEDGRVDTLGTDTSWKWAYGTHTSASLYDGETYDASQAITTMTQWNAVRVKPMPQSITAPDSPPIRRMEELPVATVIRTPSGKCVLDFGQNLAGWVRFDVSTEMACTIRLMHAEVLENGELGRRPLRECKATDTVSIEPGSSLQYEPTFTFHGFRYVQVDGWPGELNPSAFKAIALHTAMERTGHFSCSSNLLNRLHQNIVWSMRSNFLSVPTDCPQRDERFGWTGDINMFAPTGNFLYDTAGVLISWLKDTAAEQAQSNGIVPLTVPNVIPDLAAEPHAIWGDAAIMLPWSLYQSFGDTSILSRQFASMQAWLRAIPRSKTGLWDYQSDWKLGDWLDPAAPPDDPGKAATDPLLVSDAFLVHVTGLMVEVSKTLGRRDEEALYAAEHRRLHEALVGEYVTPSGRLAADTQTAYALMLHFDLYVGEGQRAKAAERLEWLVRRVSRFRIATGFAGTPCLGLAMTKIGLSGLFYRMLFERKCPSWLYPVTMGATTVWERWDSMLPSGEINPGEMTSFNHYALGSVADWMHRVILGLRSIDPGWSTFAAEPIPGGPLRWAEGSYRSSYGLCHVRWEIREAQAGEASLFWMRVVVPPNTRARILSPGQEKSTWVGSGTYEVTTEYSEASWPPRAIYARNMDHSDDCLANGDSWDR